MKEKKLPEIKKKISSYISSEDGKITKEAILKVGTLVTAAAASSAILSKTASAEWKEWCGVKADCPCNQNFDAHCNNTDLSIDPNTHMAVGKHSHAGDVCDKHCSY